MSKFGHALLICALLSALSSLAHAERGVVALRVSGCDYYIISAPTGYVVAEWYGGYDPSRGDLVIGSFDGYGFKTLFFNSSQNEGRTYIEDYMLDQDQALEQISEKCN